MNAPAALERRIDTVAAERAENRALRAESAADSARAAGRERRAAERFPPAPPDERFIPEPYDRAAARAARSRAAADSRAAAENLAFPPGSDDATTGEYRRAADLYRAAAADSRAADHSDRADGIIAADPPMGPERTDCFRRAYKHRARAARARARAADYRARAAGEAPDSGDTSTAR